MARVIEAGQYVKMYVESRRIEGRAIEAGKRRASRWYETDARIGQRRVGHEALETRPLSFNATAGLACGARLGESGCIAATGAIVCTKLTRTKNPTTAPNGSKSEESTIAKRGCAMPPRQNAQNCLRTEKIRDRSNGNTRSVRKS